MANRDIFLFRQPFDLYPDVTIRPRFNFDDEIESIDVIIDNLPDALHCEEFAMNDVSEPDGYENRFKVQRKIALKELTPGIYNEHGNLIRKRR